MINFDFYTSHTIKENSFTITTHNHQTILYKLNIYGLCLFFCVHFELIRNLFNNPLHEYKKKDGKKQMKN